MTEHTHEYDCIVCGAHFDRQTDLVAHNEKEHLATATGNERPRTPESDKERELEREENQRR